MKEAFEKIRKRIAMLYSECPSIMSIINPKIEDVKERNAYFKCLEIVSEVEAEYSNGWIPCSERLPKEDSYCLVTYESGRVGIMEYLVTNKWGWNGELGDNRVIAWMPLPEPYKPEKGV